MTLGRCRVGVFLSGVEVTPALVYVLGAVDAVLFWMVWDAEKACTEVEDYYAAVSFLAQAAMREAAGLADDDILAMVEARLAFRGMAIPGGSTVCPPAY